MKKRILTFLLAASMILLTGCHSSNNSTPTGGNPDSSKEELTKLTLNEVAHSIFYAPMYVAIEKDYFRQEGIELCPAHPARRQFSCCQRRDARF